MKQKKNSASHSKKILQDYIDNKYMYMQYKGVAGCLPIGELKIGACSEDIERAWAVSTVDWFIAMPLLRYIKDG